MTAPASTPPASQVHPRRLAWFDRISAYRQPIGLALGLGLFVLALVACKHLLDELDPGALRAALLDVPPSALAGALTATLAGFAVLLGYEWSASRYADVRLPAASLVLGGFSAFAIGNAVGLSMLSGGSVRYRLYTRLGLGAGAQRTLGRGTRLQLPVRRTRSP